MHPRFLLTNQIYQRSFSDTPNSQTHGNLINFQRIGIFVRPSLAGFALHSAVILSMCGVCAGQSATKPAEEPPGVRFTLNTSLVQIPATITDPLNRFVLGLHKEDFHLYED